VSGAYALAVVIGSVRQDRVGPAVARWFTDLARAHTAGGVDVIDLRDLAIPADLSGGGDAGTFTARIDRADAVVIVTPEYNRGYPGPLKTAIDTALPEWRAKAVGFVGYGGMSGGLRAVEQLRTVFAELHTATMQAAVGIPYVWEHLDESGDLCPPERAGRTATTLLRQLSWWTQALMPARVRSPYDG